MYRAESNEIAIRSSVAELVAAWDQSAAEITAGFKLVHDAQERLKHLFSGVSYSRFDVRNSRTNAVDFQNPEHSLENLSRQVWAALTERLELRKVLSLERLKQLDRQLETGTDLPPLTLDNVNAMLASNLENLEKFAEEKIHEVYEYLRPERSKLKTNEKSVAAGIGSKVILSWAVEKTWSGGGFSVNYHRRDQIRAVDQVFHLLDGQKPANEYDGALTTAISQQTKNGGGLAETQYFRAKCCQNHNLHLEFKRADLVRLFNLVAGGMRLTAARAA